jgi:hypothetical protein
MAWFRSGKRIALGFLLIAIAPVTVSSQSAAIEHGAAANREYAAVFAHPDDPCSANEATAPYLQCTSNELAFVGQHLDAFVENLRGVAGLRMNQGTGSTPFSVSGENS